MDSTDLAASSSSSSSELPVELPVEATTDSPAEDPPKNPVHPSLLYVNMKKMTQDPISQWIMMYTGRPKSERELPESPTCRVERERRETDEWIAKNPHRTLESLLQENRESQLEKQIEYQYRKNKKAPTLDEQKIGPDGRYIFSEEYIDFMFYRELQPLVDLRSLHFIEDLLKEKIVQRDAAKKAKEEAEAAEARENKVRIQEIREECKILMW
ncbi:hypothetical protein B9Z55_026227 [Caenorhabditis nigoni]|uniref:Uncharacterized protein n=1 Tax=Caenorhabditis nigoni TaxID=1611254 RepID=A0A2G5T2D5_9PELO|nr:hypothetical protein B9Z55_026227 [Caenorhabditis nigoni]